MKFIFKSLLISLLVSILFFLGLVQATTFLELGTEPNETEESSVVLSSDQSGSSHGPTYRVQELQSLPSIYSKESTMLLKLNKDGTVQEEVSTVMNLELIIHP